MNDPATDVRWARLVALLRPIHAQATATARRLARSSADGDDLYQEAVLRAFDKLDTLRDESKFGAWFYATLLSRHRSRSRRAFWSRFLALEELAPGDDPVGEDGRDWAGERSASERARRALASLAPEAREAVVLFELDGYSIEEIAALQGASVPAVKSRLARGRQRLARYYERRGWAADVLVSGSRRGAAEAS